MRNKITHTILFIIVLCSCGDNVAFNSVIRKVYKEDRLQNTNYVVIIPSVGCGGCILSIEDFYLKNRELKGVEYLFSNVISHKELRMKGIYESKNTTIDKTNIIMEAYPSENRIYPCVLKLKNGRVVETYYQTPKSNALKILRDIK